MDQSDLLITTSEPVKNLVDAAVTILRGYLLSEWWRRKTPYGLDAALATAVAAKSDTTDSIFLRAGFSTWIAYFLASTSEYHFSGRQSQRQTITALNLLPAEERRLAAKRVGEAVPHHSVQNAIEKMLRDPRRRRLLSSAYTQDLRESRQMPSHRASNTLSVGQPPPTPPMDTITTRSDGRPTTKEQGQRCSHACLQGVADIFPDYMNGAIERDFHETNGRACWNAAITMEFPCSSVVDCSMSILIRQDTVEHIARTLFGCHLEVESTSSTRRLILPHGARAVPCPEITLHGVHDEAIQNLLGGDVHRAIDSSRLRQEEVVQGIRATRCVSMNVSGNAHQGAVIDLKLGLQEASQMKARLYTSSDERCSVR